MQKLCDAVQGEESSSATQLSGVWIHQAVPGRGGDREVGCCTEGSPLLPSVVVAHVMLRACLERTISQVFGVSGGLHFKSPAREVEAQLARQGIVGEITKVAMS